MKATLAIVAVALKLQPWVDCSLHVGRLLSGIASDVRHNLLRLPR